MLFPTAEYALFFLFVFGAAWGLHRWVRVHHGFLLLSSYAFYAYGDWRSLPLLVGVSLVAGLVAQALTRQSRPRVRKVLVCLGVTLALATLAVFKYLSFFVLSAMSLFEVFGLRAPLIRLPEIMLPVGVSFFVFHAISLMVDAYRGQIPVRVRLLDAMLYVAFFPQLVAGPILRANTFLPQLATARNPQAIEASKAVGLIVAGLVKKVLIAHFLGTHLVDPVFESPHLHRGLETMLAIYGYAAQIFCDFSGYTDIAIGSALLLGYHFPPNFRAPALAESPQDFWRRWHLTLSSWLRDYLFISLGGSRRGAGRTLVNLALTMIIGGLWHGAAFTFVLWGALHALGLVVHRLWAASTLGLIQRLRHSRPWRLFAVVATFHFVCLGWVFFRAPTVSVGLEVLRAIGEPSTLGSFLSPALLLALVAGLLVQMLPPGAFDWLRRRFERLPLPVQGLVLGMFILCLEALAPVGVAPFIYFRF